MPTPLLALSLAELPETAWDLLARSLKRRKDPLRTPVLATVGGDGRPQARHVVLRGADPQAGTLVAYTDARSQKVDALLQHPWAELCFFPPRHGLQLRAVGDARVLRGEERCRQAWAKTPGGSRRSYLTEDAPGTPLACAGDGLPKGYDPDSPEQLARGQELFAIVELSVERIDWLVLGSEHRRAEIRRDDEPRASWTATWLVP